MERGVIRKAAAIAAGVAMLMSAASVVLAAQELVTTTVQADKTSAKAGETVTFTVTLKNNDTDQPITVTCSTTYQDPSTGQTVTATSNTLELARLGWTIAAPVLKIPINPTLEFVLSSFTVDGSPVTPSTDGNVTTVPVPDLAAGQSRTVRWQATVR